MGSLYKRGKMWWIKYYKNGKPYRESTGTDKKMVAKKVLDRKEGDIAQGMVPGIQFDKVTFDELAEELLTRLPDQPEKITRTCGMECQTFKGVF